MKRVLYFCATIMLTVSILLASCPFKVSASTVNLYNSNLGGSYLFSELLPVYYGLSATGKAVADYIMGTYSSSYFGLKGFTNNTLSDVSSTVNWLGDLGSKTFDFLVNPINSVVDAFKNNTLRNLFSDVLRYAQSVNIDFNSWLNSIRTEPMYINYDEGIVNALSDLFGNGSIEFVDEWQTESNVLRYHAQGVDVDFSLIPPYVLGKISEMVHPQAFICQDGGLTYVYFVDLSTIDIKYIFIDEGNINVYCYLLNSAKERYSFGQIIQVPNCIRVSFYYQNYSSYKLDVNMEIIPQPARYYGIDLPIDLMNIREVGYGICTEHCIDNLPYIIGADPLTAIDVTENITLGINSISAHTYAKVPVREAALDIGSFADSLVDSDILTSVVDNSVDVANAQPLTLADFKDFVFNVETPESGIVIPSNFFSGLTTYIQYLWTFAEPLVLYTRDLLLCLTFDGQGLSWIFFGICSLGIIGGVVYKFLQ